MTDSDPKPHSGNPFDPIVVGVVGLACLLFVWAIFKAGHASVLCDPRPGVRAPPPNGVCDAAGLPFVNPYLTSIVTPLTATLATYFGAALGLANAQSQVARMPEKRLHFLLRWGGLVRPNNEIYSLIQTLAAYVYFFGLLVAGYYLYRDLQPPTSEALDTPYTHIIIKTCGSALAGVIVGVLALALGVKSATQKP